MEPKSHFQGKRKSWDFQCQRLFHLQKKTGKYRASGLIVSSLARKHTHSERETHTSKCALKLYALHQMSDVIVLK